MKLKLVLLSTLLMALIVNAKQFAPNESLWYSQPAEKWLQALPIGNGTLGGMVFGGIEKEQIQFNESSLITGTTSINGNEKPTVGYYQPFGDVYIDFGSLKAHSYRRELSLTNAIHSVTFSSGDVAFRRECFSSYPDKVLVTHFSANKKGKISFILKLKDAHNGKLEVRANKIIATGLLPENGMRYESQVLVLTSGGKITSKNASITVTNANQATILLVAGTDFSKDFSKSFKGEHPHAQLENTLALAAVKSYDELRNTHIADYQTLYNRVHLNLGTTPKMSTIDRLKAVKNGAKDPALEALLFQYGRYLLISSSRAGGLPTNLQGIWNNEYKPAWYSQYTTNINVEMNYWPAEPTGLSECTAPYFDWVENLARVNKNTTDPKLQTKRGWIAYSTNNIMGGPSTWGLHRPGSAWMSQHFWEHYAFTGDKEFLKNRAYPMLKDVSGYWEDHLVESKDGKLITPDGWSPEHGPGLVEGDRTPYPGVSYDQQIVYDLFSNVVDAAAELNMDTEYKNKMNALRNRLLGPQIGKWGQLQEWMEDWDSPNDKHRHNSHMFGLHPGRQISPITTPEWANAALISLNARGDVSTGWSTAWKINLFARLGLGNRSYNMINMLFKKCILENMFDTHPPFQIDGNFGYTAGVSEMLLQSHLKTDKGYLLQILPALPEAWTTGEIKGLRARGGFVVDISWKKGVLVSLKIISMNGNDFKLRYKEKVLYLSTTKGKAYKFNAASFSNHKQAIDYNFGAMVQPVPFQNRFIDDNYAIWCGSVIKDKNGKFYMFYSRWPRPDGHQAWIYSSEIALAKADKPEGPYKHVKVVLPARGAQFWDGVVTHNPYITFYKGKYYLYHMGTTGSGERNATNWWVQRNRQRIGVAVATDIEGEWKRFNQPVLSNNEKDSTAYDAMLVSNPAITFNDKGGVLMVYKQVCKNGTLKGGRVRFGVATAKSPLGPFTKHPNPIFESKDGKNTHMEAEDPFIWFQKGYYYAIVRDVVGKFTGKGGALALMVSKNGIDWETAEHPLVVSNSFEWADGKQSGIAIERPWVYFENGVPKFLYGAMGLDSKRTHTFNIAMPLKQ